MEKKKKKKQNQVFLSHCHVTITDLKLHISAAYFTFMFLTSMSCLYNRVSGCFLYLN